MTMNGFTLIPISYKELGTACRPNLELWSLFAISSPLMLLCSKLRIPVSIRSLPPPRPEVEISPRLSGCKQNDR
jgi:hypothetical protein